MSKETLDAAAAIDRFLRLLKGLEALPPKLRSLAELEEAEAKVRARIDALLIQEAEVSTKMGKAKVDIQASVVQMDEIVVEARKKAETIVAEAHSQAKDIVAKAQKSARTIVSEATQALDSINQQSEAARKQLGDIVKRAAH